VSAEGIGYHGGKSRPKEDSVYTLRGQLGKQTMRYRPRPRVLVRILAGTARKGEAQKTLNTDHKEMVKKLGMKKGKASGHSEKKPRKPDQDMAWANL